MNNDEVMKKYGITKKFGIMIGLQMLLMMSAFVLTIVGLINNTNPYREIVYTGQACSCALIIVFGIFRFKDRDRHFLRVVLNSYALLEALRAALLNTEGVNPWVGVLARFILACLACLCVLVAERMEQGESERISIAMVVMEIILYIVFLVGFPGIMLGHLNRFLPLVGVFIAGSIALLQKGKNNQLGKEDSY